MEVEINVEAKRKRLNHGVAITVVLLSVFMAVSKIKDDNVVQAMQLAKANAVDFWSEYQAKKIKLHLTESTLVQAKLMAIANPSAAGAIEAEEIQMRLDIARYKADAEKVQRQAKAKEVEYDALNFHDDQFDLSDAALAVAIACAAVAALTESWGLLVFGWLVGSLGVVFGLAGFAGWQIHPDWLINWLS